jgi:hypothetical protein
MTNEVRSVRYVWLALHLVLMSWAVAIGFAVGTVYWSMYAGFQRAKEFQLWLTK